VNENKVDFVTYTKDHSSVVKSGVNAISEVLNGTDIAEKRSLLFCLDKYLDPYYGYNLPYFDDIITLLQEQLFLIDVKEVKEDILQLLRDYAKKSLDYLAEKLEKLDSEPELLEDALYALGNTYNLKYVPVIIRYESHHNSTIKNAVKEILIDLSKSNISHNE
jgi:hypothetical protein